MGDVAMLQVAISRIFEQLPHAEVHVLTWEPAKLEQFAPGCRPLRPELRTHFMRPWATIGKAHHLVPSPMRPALKKYEMAVRMAYPRAAVAWETNRLFHRRSSIAGVKQFYELLEGADLVIATGGGYLNDVFAEHAELALATLRLAQRLGKRTMLFGQGIGPLAKGPLLSEVCETVKRAEVVTLREGRTALPLLRSTGVGCENAIVTGDDAVELAYQNRPMRGSETGIGINLRVARYSGVNGETSGRICRVVSRFAESVKSPLMGIPITRHGPDDDAEALARHLGIAGAAGEEIGSIATPVDSIRLAGRCRVVVTGSYHAAASSPFFRAVEAAISGWREVGVLRAEVSGAR